MIKGCTQWSWRSFSDLMILWFPNSLIPETGFHVSGQSTSNPQNHLQLFSAWTISLCTWGVYIKRKHSLLIHFEQGICFHSLCTPTEPWNPKCIWTLFDSNNPFYILNLLIHFLNAPSLSHPICFTATGAALSRDESFSAAQEVGINSRAANREWICQDLSKPS